MGFFTPDYFIHSANVLLLIAYSVRDVLWLRLFAVAASLIAIPYYVLQPTMLWAPLAWSVVFAGINLFQSWLLFVERRPELFDPLFYFGNLIAETGDAGSPLRISSLDLGLTRSKLLSSATLADRTDFDRDGRVNALDLGAIRRNLFQSLDSIVATP